MSRLTWKEPNGKWGVNGLTWYQLLQHIYPKDIPDIIYGCLHKLMQYEETGLSPEDVEHLQMDYEIRTGDTRWKGGQDGGQEETVGAVQDDPEAGPGSVPGGSGADPGT